MVLVCFLWVLCGCLAKGIGGSGWLIGVATCIGILWRLSEWKREK